MRTPKTHIHNSTVQVQVAESETTVQSRATGLLLSPTLTRETLLAPSHLSSPPRRDATLALVDVPRSSVRRPPCNRPIQHALPVPRTCSAIQLYSMRVYSRAIQDTAYTLYSPIRRPSGKVYTRFVSYGIHTPHYCLLTILTRASYYTYTSSTHYLHAPCSLTM